ncbi:hypothetical protein C0992_003955, partial [Termitomyces sp. T32_za158]
MGGPVQYADTTQGSVLAHSTPFQTMQPEQGAKQGHEVSSEQTTRPQGASLATVTGQTEQLRDEAPAGPPMKEKLRRSGKEPQVGLKSSGKVLDLAPELDSSDEEEDGRSLLTLSVQLQLVLDRFPTVTKESTQKRLQLYVVKHLQLMAHRGQRVPRADSTEYIELFAWIFELELNEYIKRKAARGTATSTATPAESVDYDALLRQRAPDIAEAMDILNAPRQANESQQDYEKRQNAARRQANVSGMPHQALSEVETAMLYHAGEEQAEELPEMRTPHQRVTIKEEEHDESVPDKPVTPQRVARRVHLVDNWNERINYQRIRNQDLRVRGKSLIDDQGIVFEGWGGVTPIDDMRRQFIARTGEPDRDPGNDSGDDDHHSDRGQGRRTNDQEGRDCRDDCRPSGHQSERPVPWGPQGPHRERRTEEPAHQAIRAWSLPSPHDLCASTPGMNEAVKIHMDHMHDHLTRLVDDSLGVRFKFPDRVKPRRADGKHIRSYAGGH